MDSLSSIFLFQWMTPEDGYQWVQSKKSAKNPSQRILVEANPYKRKYVQRHTIVENPKLFLTLAQLELTEEAILNFANKYGALVLLGSAPEVKTYPITQSENLDGETLAFWEKEILDLRRLNNLWQRCKSDTTKSYRELKQMFSYTESAVIFNGEGGKELIISKAIQKQASIFDRIHNNPELSAKEYIRIKLIQKMNSRINAVPVWVDSEKQAIRLQPNSLIGAIWLQFCRVVTEKVNFRECMHCNKIIEIEKMRTTRKYCSDFCRLKDFRKKSKTK